MVKDKTKLMFFLLVIFGVFYLFASSNKIMSVEVLNEQSKETYAQDLNVPSGLFVTQSLFKSDIINEYILNSAKSLTNDDKKVVLTLDIKNEFKDRIILEKTNYFKNSVLISEKQYTTTIFPGDSVQIKTEELDLDGIDGSRNNIKIEAFLINERTKQIKIIAYNFNYFKVTRCSTDNECTTSGYICDLGNNARFSTAPNTYYCAKKCLDNQQCYKGQLCHFGVCGY